MNAREIYNLIQTGNQQDAQQALFDRRFDGEHVLSGTGCWCRPEVVHGEDPLEPEIAAERLERCDG